MTELDSSQCHAVQRRACCQASVAGSLSRGWSSNMGYLTEALGVSPGQTWPQGLPKTSTAPPGNLLQAPCPPPPPLINLPMGSVHQHDHNHNHDHDHAAAARSLVRAHFFCPHVFIGLALPHTDHGTDWCLGLRIRQKLQFQPHPNLRHFQRQVVPRAAKSDEHDPLDASVNHVRSMGLH